jgi:hypothetical protein
MAELRQTTKKSEAGQMKTNFRKDKGENYLVFGFGECLRQFADVFRQPRFMPRGCISMKDALIDRLVDQRNR